SAAVNPDAGREPEPNAEPRRSTRSMLFGEAPTPSPASQPQEPEPAGVGPESEPESTASSWPSYPWARDQGSTSTESGSTSAGDDAAVEPAPEPVNESTTSLDPWKATPDLDEPVGDAVAAEPDEASAETPQPPVDDAAG